MMSLPQPYLPHFSCNAVYAGSESSLLICVQKMNEGLTGLERHEDK